MLQDLRVPVLRNVAIDSAHFLLEFEAPAMIGSMHPAQFFMIGIPGGETLLRRPYSVCGLPGTFDDGAPGAAQVLYKVVGRGTSLLAALKSGAMLDVLGPLGHGFTLPEPGRLPLLVAGGIGSAPFPALVAGLGARRARMFYGARTADDLPLDAWFERRTDLTRATEDGSTGWHGRVTEPLAEFLERSDPQALHVYACGPEPMLRAVARLATRHSLRTDLALEAHMACGFGVCLGCVVPTRRSGSEPGYERVCVEGPVLPAEVLAW